MSRAYTCIDCGVSEGAAKTGRLPLRCRPCDVEAQRARYAANPRAYNLRYQHRMTEAQYDEMLARQGGRCAICCRSAERLQVDHDHACCDSDKSCGECVRGLLCHMCNKALGLFGDSAEALLAAFAYVTATAVEEVRT